MTYWEFTNEDLEHLVSEVKKYPAVYDVTHPNYRDHQVRTEIWQRIGQELAKGSEVCKRKWTYVRDVYVKKKKEDLKGWKGKRQKWWLSDAMSFLDPFNQPRKKGNEAETDNEDSMYYDECETTLALSPEISLVEESEEGGDDDSHNNNSMGYSYQTFQEQQVMSAEEALRRASYNASFRHPVEDFFSALAKIVISLPPRLQATVKRDVARIVSDAECSLYPVPDGSGQSRPGLREEEPPQAPAVDSATALVEQATGTSPESQQAYD